MQSTHSNSEVLILGAEDIEQKTTVGIASILARVINKKIAKTKASFWILARDT